MRLLVFHGSSEFCKLVFGGKPFWEEHVGTTFDVLFCSIDRSVKSLDTLGVGPGADDETVLEFTGGAGGN